jgi:hypothetical protein
MLIAEKYLGQNEVNTGATNDSLGYTAGWGGTYDTVRVLFSNGTQVDQTQSQPRQDGPSGLSARWGSPHPGSFNAVFADRSVRRIRYSVDLNILAYAVVRDDGQPFSFGALE